MVEINAQDSATRHSPSAVVELTSSPDFSTRNLQISRWPLAAAKCSKFQRLGPQAPRRSILLAISNKKGERFDKKLA